MRLVERVDPLGSDCSDALLRALDNWLLTHILMAEEADTVAMPVAVGLVFVGHVDLTFREGDLNLLPLDVDLGILGLGQGAHDHLQPTLAEDPLG